MEKKDSAPAASVKRNSAHASEAKKKFRDAHTVRKSANAVARYFKRRRIVKRSQKLTTTVRAVARVNALVVSVRRALARASPDASKFQVAHTARRSVSVETRYFQRRRIAKKTRPANAAGRDSARVAFSKRNLAHASRGSLRSAAAHTEIGIASVVRDPRFIHRVIAKRSPHAAVRESVRVASTNNFRRATQDCSRCRSVRATVCARARSARQARAREHRRRAVWGNAHAALVSARMNLHATGASPKCLAAVVIAFAVSERCQEPCRVLRARAWCLSQNPRLVGSHQRNHCLPR